MVCWIIGHEGHLAATAALIDLATGADESAFENASLAREIGERHGGHRVALARSSPCVQQERRRVRVAQRFELNADLIQHRHQQVSHRRVIFILQVTPARQTALAAADVGMAMATGTDIAMETAGITLMRGEPLLAAPAVDIARRTTAKIRQGLFWAFIFNVVGIPLAAFGYLSPVLAGGAMALSSVFVVANALLLRTWRL